MLCLTDGCDNFNFEISTDYANLETYLFVKGKKGVLCRVGRCKEREGGALGQEEGENNIETVGGDQEEGGECGAVLIAGSSSSGVDVVVNNDTQPTNHVGVKKSQTARELAKRNVAIAHWSDGIHALAGASGKRNKIAEQLVEVERESPLLQLFSMEGIHPETRKRFLEVTQAKAIA